MLFVCDWWNNFRCEETPNYYEMNANLYDYSKDPSASNSGTTSNVNNTNNKNNNNREIATRFGDKMSGKSEKLVSENEETTSAGELPSTSSVYFVDDYKEATKGKSSAAKSKSSSSPLTVGRRASAALERESEPVEDVNNNNSQENGKRKANFERNVSDDVEYFFNDDSSTLSPASPSSSLSLNSPSSSSFLSSDDTTPTDL